ncbi:MAG: type I restriction-modification system endonuclease [Deltaproteobacteria bacterium]|nr:type I restriction-modification system endonuclease [Deltaproteobacteria bacterium]
MTTDQASPNFGFLKPHGTLFVRLPSLAERYVHEDPNTAILKLRQFAELLARQAAARLGLEAGPELNQIDVIRSMEDRGAIDRRLADVFHAVRKSGNQANHAFLGSTGEAIHLLKHARQLGVWFHRAFGGRRDFKAGPFLRPTALPNPTDALLQQVQALEDDLKALRARTAEEKEKTKIEAELRRAAETRARAAEDEIAAALELGEEAERLLAVEQARYSAELADVSRKAADAAPVEIQRVVESAAGAAKDYNPDEAETRHLIDGQLRAEGWEVDSVVLRHSRGVRPARGRNLAIAEWPTASGPADYVLFRGLTPLAIIEAKRRNRRVAAEIEQAKRYSRGYLSSGDEKPPEGGPWEEFMVPFLFSTNGRPYLRQLVEMSGIWFLDARHPTNHPRARDGWPTPDDLGAMVKQDIQAADRKLEMTPTDDLPLRDYQYRAVRKTEEAIRAGRREILLAMATGTGKTRTAIALIYRLIKAGRFRRVLFLVDRSALGDQAEGALKDVRLEQQQAFTDHYDVKFLEDLRPDADTRLHVATIQGMVKRLLYSSDDASPLSVDTYDCIVVDECHRGYTLDREMSDAELAFRDEADYISKYRRVLEHFDAVKIGLTATPALHTTEIFGKPVTTYGYRRAVIDGYLIDHEPPIQVKTKLAVEGIRWEPGEQVEAYDHSKGQVELFNTPDEIEIEVEGFNKRVVTENFNRTVCESVAQHIDPSLPGKTLVYCVTDAHADLVVRLFKEAFTQIYGTVEDDAVQKITGSVDRPREKIRHFKNERLPSVAVTVDLLTTGIDVAEIVNLVFIRRVKSRILYDQMIGRATRLCPGLFGDRDKEVFQIFDAVGLYETLKDHTEMKPVVQNPTQTFGQLVQELTTLRDEEFRQQVLDQLIVKLQRIRRPIEEGWPEEFETAAGMTPRALIEQLRTQTPQEVAEYFEGREHLVELLGRRLPRAGYPLLISHHPDELLEVERGYGESTRPEDYLESFGQFIAEHVNEIEALQIVTTRPRSLTRQQLRELKLALDREGFSEINLRTAYRESTNQDIAASIIGYIRQRALGTPLMPYDQRVANALRRLLARRSWTPPQRSWLERIGKQLVQETIVDREALDRGQFGAQGGFQRLNKLFDGQMATILADLHDFVWEESA